jgi:hypothetical protein
MLLKIPAERAGDTQEEITMKSSIGSVQLIVQERDSTKH